MVGGNETRPDEAVKDSDMTPELLQDIEVRQWHLKQNVPPLRLTRLSMVDTCEHLQEIERLGWPLPPMNECLERWWREFRS